MPLYLDIHALEGVTIDQVTQAHLADLQVQHRHGVTYQRYWFNEARSKIFCLCSAPDPETARRVHQESHGLVAEKIIEVTPDLVEEFLGGGQDDGVHPVRLQDGKRFDSGLRTVLFTDIVGSTDLTQRVGDAGAMAIIDEHDSIVRGAVATCRGREVKHTGDGIMAAFVSPADAVRCAMLVQRALQSRNAREAVWPLRVRIGAAVGEPVDRQNDLFGATVQLAARLCSQAQPGEVLVAAEVAEQAREEGLAYDTLTDVMLKGFEKPQAVRRVRWED